MSAVLHPLAAEGMHAARLAAVRRFGNAYGPRIGFEFELPGGQLVTASAAPSISPKGKLAELLRGLLGRDPSEAELADPKRLVGKPCRVLVRTEANKSGRLYSNVVTVFR